MTAPVMGSGLPDETAEPPTCGMTLGGVAKAGSVPLMPKAVLPIDPPA